MAYDYPQAIKDFEECELDEFGESVEYINGLTGNVKTLNATRARYTDNPATMSGATATQTKSKIQILISRGSTLGKSDIHVGVDKVRMYVLPDDTVKKTLKVVHATHEYGVWRLGLA